jgi:hypothetical protein
MDPFAALADPAVALGEESQQMRRALELSPAPLEALGSDVFVEEGIPRGTSARSTAAKSSSSRSTW